MSNNKSITSEEYWKTKLSEEEYHVLRQKGTERPHTGEYNIHSKNGTYSCKGCDTPLFESSQKFEAHCGWPSFDKAIEGKITYIKDNSHGMIRTEIICTNCNGHLGHVFDDGPTETGVRYCVNSISLNFQEDN